MANQIADRLDELLAAAAVEHLGEDAGLGSITAWVNLHRAAPQLSAAALDLLNRLDNITTDEFSKGGEKTERDALREIVDAAAGITA